MATSTSIPLSEYLSKTYEPDCEYIDGELKERNVGEQPHGHIQAIITSIFRENRRAWSTRSITETRVQTLPGNFRVPDICILRSSDPHDSIIRFAPYICIEVLSKDDSLSDLQEKVDELLAMGVAHIWIVDPWLRIGYIASARGFEHPIDGVFRVEGTSIRISLAELFAEMDETFA
jgi:Uma2 family endonuclease